VRDRGQGPTLDEKESEVCMSINIATNEAEAYTSSKIRVWEYRSGRLGDDTDATAAAVRFPVGRDILNRRPGDLRLRRRGEERGEGGEHVRMDAEADAKKSVEVRRTAATAADGGGPTVHISPRLM
jgi:hypothetical protein